MLFTLQNILMKEN
jgi:hypothetical protein